MRVEGAYTFPGDMERVFATLTNPDALARAIPGCERFIQFGPASADGDLAYETRLRLGSQRQPYTLNLRVKAVRRPAYLTVELRGYGPSGLMTGAGSLDLVEQGNHTVVAYRFNFTGAELPETTDVPSQSASFIARATCAHLADEIFAATEDDHIRLAGHGGVAGEIRTARGRIVTSLARRRAAQQPLALTQRVIWMSAGLVMGLSAIALAVGIVRRIGGHSGQNGDAI
jgi:carbon monoxide dehydrogenase subunit G